MVAQAGAFAVACPRPIPKRQGEADAPGPKPAKSKEAKPPVSRKSPQGDSERVHPKKIELVTTFADQGYKGLFHLLAVAHWPICMRATSAYLPLPSGLKMDASPSQTSNQSLPSASTMFGLWVTISVFVPASGEEASMARSA
jgi:hypothetical protein